MSMRPSAASPHSPAPAEDFASDVEYYLGLEPRQLPSRYLYDALGSALFDAICDLPWYPIARAEIGLLERHGREILARATKSAGWPRPSRIVELGPGNGTKLRTLLETRVEHPGRVDLHLIDISAKALDEASHAMTVLDGVKVVRHEATYENGLREVAQEPRSNSHTLVLFLGSNIGNFDPPGAAAFLRGVRTALRAGDDLLVGVDLVKPEADLILAYDDPLGITAAFNRNLLVRINRELGGDADLKAFGHHAVWNRWESRVEMHLVSLRRQRVHIPAAHIEVALDRGDTIWTESSYKYQAPAATALLESAGFRMVGRWMAADARFALMLVRAD